MIAFAWPVAGLAILAAEPTEAEKWANLVRMMTPTPQEQREAAALDAVIARLHPARQASRSVRVAGEDSRR